MAGLEIWTSSVDNSCTNNLNIFPRLTRHKYLGDQPFRATQGRLRRPIGASNSPTLFRGLIFPRRPIFGFEKIENYLSFCHNFEKIKLLENKSSKNMNFIFCFFMQELFFNSENLNEKNCFYTPAHPASSRKSPWLAWRLTDLKFRSNFQNKPRFSVFIHMILYQ